MIANLPLLFANGYPTALSKITAGELEKFITFMVTCSWGHDTAKDILQPPWWPEDVHFKHPFVIPNVIPKDWETKLKNVVRRCYDYHKSAFLLVFSAQLARYPRKKLRYVDNRDHTTSLYYRPSGRLLVTFRNENMHYDRPDMMEEPENQTKTADIYLCDNCDSHFDNLNVLKAHERLCNNENLPSSSCSGGLSDFLSALKLQPIGHVDTPKTVTENDSRSKNVRSSINIDRGPPYPFSSLAYLKNAKSNINRDLSYSRERIERYCMDTNMPSKLVTTKSKHHQFPVRYKRPIDYWNRKHVFPHQRNKDVLDLKGQLYLFKCRPLKVRVENMSEESIQEYIDKIKSESEIKKQNEDKDIIFVEGLVNDQPMEEDSRCLDPLKKHDDCEVIDLCSDDEAPSVNENQDPRAGVTCVMKGGAILRRTAATPVVLPSEPCGARQHPFPAAILQPHPVVLIAHTLNNLQTISLE